MVKAEFSITNQNQCLVLKINGHAGQADVGKDIVCSASTILAYTVAQVVTDMYKAGKLRKRPTVEMGIGKALIVCKPLKASFDEALHTYYVVQTGYKLLATNYPKYVRLTEFELKGQE